MSRGRRRGGLRTRDNGDLRIALHRPYASALDPDRYQVQELILARALARHGIGVTIFSRWAEGVALSDPSYRGSAIALRPIGGPAPARHQTLDVGRVVEVARGAFDVVQVHEESQVTNALLGWCSPAPIVLYQGAYIDSSRAADAQKRLLRLTLGARLRSWAVTVGKTRAAAARLAEWGYRPARVIPVGFDKDYIASIIDRGAPARLGLIPPYVVGVGAMVERKRWPWALQWSAAAAAAGRSATLVLIGDGPEGTRIDRQAAALLPPGRYRRFSHLPQKETLGVIAGASSLVHPSALEEYGMVLLEALGLGTPVIALPTAGSDEMLQGLLAPALVRDETEGGRRLIALLSTPEFRAAQGDAGARVARGRLSADVMGAAFASIYRALAID
ncbi:MAG: glycosyltransferase family 4 protein [Thermoleophilia bacterium]